MQDKQERHAVPVYTLLEQPRPGSRETRMRETMGQWLARNQSRDGTGEGT